PTKSENHPQKILPAPFARRLHASATTMAAAGIATLLPKGEACAVIMRPPMEVSTKATYSTQNWGVMSICPLLNCSGLRRIRGETGFLAAGETLKSGPGL